MFENITRKSSLIMLLEILPPFGRLDDKEGVFWMTEQEFSG